MELSKRLVPAVREAGGESGLSQSQAQAFARFCCIAIAAIATVALLGWVIDVETLRSVLPNRTAMNPISAIGFALAAIADWAMTRFRANSSLTSQGPAE
jgi:hypothetical protein